VGKIVSELSMSLDGFIAGPNDGPERPLGDGGERLFAWYASGDTDFAMPGDARVVRISAASARLLREQFSNVGALVSGRRIFDIANGWGGRHPIGTPVFVVTHSIPQGWTNGVPFTFVTDGVESAVERARRGR
jgi:dihydrofolate reductase